jgi:hypothetical protein
MRDGGRPSEIGLQEQISNRLGRHWLETVVASVKGKAQYMRQVRIEKANTREPLFKRRNN